MKYCDMCSIPSICSERGRCRYEKTPAKEPPSSGSERRPYSPSSETPETDAVNSGEWDSLEIRYDLMHDLAERLERDRNYWKNTRTLELESHPHEWSDGAMVKTNGEAWRLECCPCGSTRIKTEQPTTPVVGP